jgi:molybdopterin converting factor small subunit
MPTIKFPALMKYYVENQSEVSIEASSIENLFENILIRYPTLKSHLFDSKHQLRNYFQVFVNGVHIRELNGMQTKLNQNDKIILTASAAGG